MVDQDFRLFSDLFLYEILEIILPFLKLLQIVIDQFRVQPDFIEYFV